MDVSLFSPAKINLFLAVTGRRADGFHDLVSVTAPLGFGDQLVAAAGDGRPEAGGPSFAKASAVAKVMAAKSEGTAGSRFSLECDHPEVPIDGSNLVLKAAEAFAVETGWPVRQAQGGPDPVRFRLTKRIPPGAGLGGGSSNAVAALRALNQLSGGLLDETRLAGVAATLGSDCALFLANAPVVMRGRGERVELLLPQAAARLRGRRVLLFKPSFGISTPWAYQRMIARGGDYLAAAEAEARLSAWMGGDAPVEELLFNNMEPAAFEKYGALPLLLEKLRREFGVVPRMSGSGSACYALLSDPSTDSAGSPQAGFPLRQGYGGHAGQATSAEAVTRMKQTIRACWGVDAFVQEARLL